MQCNNGIFLQFQVTTSQLKYRFYKFDVVKIVITRVVTELNIPQRINHSEKPSTKL